MTSSTPSCLLVVGTSTSDTIKGTSLADHYNGLGGNDVISGLAGDDTLIGGAGSDTIYGGAGADNLDLGAGGAQGADRVVLQSRTDAGDHVTGFDVDGADHDYLVLSDSFSKARKATDLDDERDDGQLRLCKDNGVQDDSGVVVDLINATISNSDAFEAVIFSLFPEGVGSTVPYSDDPTALAAFADEFSDELQIFSARGDDLLIVSNAVFGSSPDQFAAFLYVEATGANGSDPEISGNELTLLASFESTGDVTSDHLLLG